MNHNMCTDTEFAYEVETFVKKEIEPFAENIDSYGNLPDNLIAKIGAFGLFKGICSRKNGGYEYSYKKIGLLNEILGKYCSSTRTLINVQGMSIYALDHYGNAHMKKDILPNLLNGSAVCSFCLTEENIGSDANSIETKVIKDDNSYLLNGKKKWISFGMIADYFLVFGKVEDKGACFLVNKWDNGVFVHSVGEVTASRGTYLAEIEFRDCRIGYDRIVGKEGFGVKQIAMSCLDFGRFTVAFGCLGTSERCLELAISEVLNREQFDNKLIDHQIIKKMISEMTVKVELIRALCYSLAYLKEKNSPVSIYKCLCAKYAASKFSIEVSQAALQIFGANGIKSSSVVNRLHRESLVSEIVEGTSQIHESLIAKHISQQYNYLKEFMYE